MAFRQPTLPPRRVSPVRDDDSQHDLVSQPIELSQQWVLFSPIQAQHTSASSSATRTAGLSRLSDFGSLNTIPQSAQDESGLSDVIEDADELDSLDDGLNAFQEPLESPRRPDHSGGTILPTHDGLGMFSASTSAVQDQLWRFEKYNPRRRRPHQLAVISDAVIEDESGAMDQARVDRIEKWRLEQSRILLEEVEHENQANKKNSLNSGEHSHLSDRLSEERHSETTSNTPEQHLRSIWQRITQRLRDLIGIDDVLLSIILGDSLVPERGSPRDLDAKAHQSIHLGAEGVEDDWDDGILKRLSRDLGVLLHRLSAYPGMASVPFDLSGIDYAGMPVRQHVRETSVQDIPSKIHEASRFVTMAEVKHRDPLVCERQDYRPSEEGVPLSPTAEVQYWEQTPDLKTLFGYLSRRFMSRPPTSMANSPNIATTTTPDSIRRAAIIRQHHPLVARARTHERPARRVSRASQYLATPSTPNLKRAGASCASLSTKRSRLATSDGGSRNYWDIGGSMGSESLSFGGVGAWGEA